MPANLENSAVATGLEKVSFHSNPKKGKAKECSNYHTIALISHASKVMLKILQARLQQYVNHELPDIQASLRKGKGTRDQIANICWIIEKAENMTQVSFKHQNGMTKTNWWDWNSSMGFCERFSGREELPMAPRKNKKSNLVFQEQMETCIQCGLLHLETDRSAFGRNHKPGM